MSTTIGMTIGHQAIETMYRGSETSVAQQCETGLKAEHDVVDDSGTDALERLVATTTLQAYDSIAGAAQPGGGGAYSCLSALKWSLSHLARGVTGTIGGTLAAIADDSMTDRDMLNHDGTPKLGDQSRVGLAFIHAIVQSDTTNAAAAQAAEQQYQALQSSGQYSQAEQALQDYFNQARG